MFRITIGVFVLLLLSSLIFFFVYNPLLQVLSSERGFLYKLSFSASKLSAVLFTLLNIVCLYQRKGLAHYLTGAFIGFSIFNLLAKVYDHFIYQNPLLTEIPDAGLAELVFPLLLIGYLVYFYVNSEVVYIIGSSRSKSVVYVLAGAAVAAVFTFLISLPR